MKTDLTQGHGSVEEMKDKLVRDLKTVGANADGLLREVGSFSSEEFAAVRTKVDGILGEAKLNSTARDLRPRQMPGAAQKPPMST